MKKLIACLFVVFACTTVYSQQYFETDVFKTKNQEDSTNFRGSSASGTVLAIWLKT